MPLMCCLVGSRRRLDRLPSRALPASESRNGASCAQGRICNPERRRWRGELALRQRERWLRPLAIVLAPALSPAGVPAGKPLLQWKAPPPRPPTFPVVAAGSSVIAVTANCALLFLASQCCSAWVPRRLCRAFQPGKGQIAEKGQWGPLQCRSNVRVPTQVVANLACFLCSYFRIRSPNPLPDAAKRGSGEHVLHVLKTTKAQKTAHRFCSPSALSSSGQS